MAVIGATGAVGQRFVQLLDGHPWFNLEIVAASDRSAGAKYEDAVSWGLEKEMPNNIADTKIERIEAETFKASGIKVIFSALPAHIAKEIEPNLTENGFKVFSNASAYRMERDVPLLIADINPEHLALVKQQMNKSANNGYIVTNPNCSVVGLATALKPLINEFQLKDVNVTTYQALSGAGYPGVPSMDILGNVIPYIPGEEDKVEIECQKILGKLSTEGIEPLPLDVLASCARVPVRDGHLESVVVDLQMEVTIDEIKNVFQTYKAVEIKDVSLPTAPEKTIIVIDDEHRPQPLFDKNNGTPARAAGMAVTVGRFKMLKNKLRFFLLVHNTIRGAAGCSIINAELAKVKGFL